jgi:hypothetical protein
MPSLAINPKASLGAYLAEFFGWSRASAALFRTKRQFGSVVRFDVGGDIATDAIAASNAIAHTAYSAETHDREAELLIRAALADGRVSEKELPQLEAALRLIKKSAEQDHDIAEAAQVPNA